MRRDGAGEAELAGAVGEHRWSATAVAPEARSVGEVRREVRDVLTAWGADSFDWALSQLLTEVVTNVVLHAATPFDVTLVHDTASGAARLRCEVSDASPRLPRPRSYSLESATGRGMKLVEQLSAAWGVDRHGRGKTVWFELVAGDDDGIPDLDAFLEAAGLSEAAEPALVPDAPRRGTPSAVHAVHAVWAVAA